eukprot:CAMPEP_0201099166 /NCGR_PEP_ID=MMETSP0812-20130820/8182_1 /ASSEMBLY_ACC=CAM_ASM_000668 /TAXON_ID=98059 /ORGANISM="Dinobryon sp., Strain UTEXLB2267" /LENGTH=38 /DNA_ID= /DNA_START= /DNA_END= /DNA_ORIENTATION=
MAFEQKLRELSVLRNGKKFGQDVSNLNVSIDVLQFDIL